KRISCLLTRKACERFAAPLPPSPRTKYGRAHPRPPGWKAGQSPNRPADANSHWPEVRGCCYFLRPPLLFLRPPLAFFTHPPFPAPAPRPLQRSALPRYLCAGGPCLAEANRDRLFAAGHFPARSTGLERAAVALVHCAFDNLRRLLPVLGHERTPWDSPRCKR